MNHKCFLILLLSILLNFPGVSQWRGAQFVHLGPEDGIACWTFDIAQDSAGLIYYGTDQGLVRYDGSEFRLFSHEPEKLNSIGPGDIWALTYASDGLLYMGSRVSGLNVFDPVTLNFTTYLLPSAISNDQAISSIAEDAKGNIWVGTRHFRLLKFIKDSRTFTEHSPEWVQDAQKSLPGVIIEILPDRADMNILWLAMPDYQEKPGEAHYTLVKYYIQENKFEAQDCRGIPKFQDEEGNLWVVSTGVTKYNPVTGYKKFFPLVSDDNGKPSPINVRDVIFYGNKYLVASPYRLLELNEKGNYSEVWKNERLGISEKLFIDRQNNLWIGRDKGVSTLNIKQQVIDFYSFSQFGLLGRLYPGRLAYDHKNAAILISGYTALNQGKDLFLVPMDKTATVLKYSFPQTVYGLATDTSGGTWISFGEYLQYYPKGIKYTANYQVMRQDMPRLWNMNFTAGGFLTGTGSSAFTWYNFNHRKWYTTNQASLQGLATFNDFQGSANLNSNTILLYSDHIFEINLTDGKITPLKISPINQYSIPEAINDVLIDQNNQYWISTLQVTGQFNRKGDSLHLIKSYSQTEGLKSAWAHELYEDNTGRIWLFASNGLSAINPKSQEIKHFGVHEGLVDHYIDPRQILTLPSGHMAMVNGPGLIIFHPDSLWNCFSNQDVPVIIKSVRSSGVPLKLTKDPNFIDEIILSPQQKYLDIQYQALAFPTDHKVTYSYRVNELHQDWINNGENKIITLSNLRAGIYHLRVKTGSPNSLSPEKYLTIRVLLPLSKQPWFLLLVFTGIACIIVGLHRWRIKNIHHQLTQKNEFKRQVAELELKALRAQMNPHFMFNSLNSIKNYILQAEPTLAAEYLSNFAHLIRLILQNSREKTITLEEEFEALKLYIELEQLRFDQRFLFDYRVGKEVTLNSIKIPPLLLQPYVENAIWHGLMPKNGLGHLIIEVFETTENVICKIEDDGIGREASQKMRDQSIKHKSFGLGINQDRIDIINSINASGISITISDKFDAEGKPSGTTVLIALAKPEL